MANRLRPLLGISTYIARPRRLGGAIWITIAVACSIAWAALFVWAPGTTAAALFASAGVLVVVAVAATL
jgi:hypothetical protein